MKSRTAQKIKKFKRTGNKNRHGAHYTYRKYFRDVDFDSECVPEPTTWRDRWPRLREWLVFAKVTWIMRSHLIRHYNDVWRSGVISIRSFGCRKCNIEIVRDVYYQL